MLLYRHGVAFMPWVGWLPPQLADPFFIVIFILLLYTGTLLPCFSQIGIYWSRESSIV